MKRRLEHEAGHHISRFGSLFRHYGHRDAIETPLPGETNRTEAGLGGRFSMKNIANRA